MSKRIGILGGSFNPIHLGHIKIANTVLNEFPIEKCLLMPSFQHPHKGVFSEVSPEDRVTMIQLALKELPKNLGIECSTFEIEKKRVVYTIETLEAHHQQGYEVLFIVGADNFLNIPSWKRYRNFFNFADFAVINRPTHAPPKIESLLPSTLSHFFTETQSDNPKLKTFEHRTSHRKLYFVPMAPFAMSSTQIRSMLMAGKDVSSYIPTSVLSYIYGKNLYREVKT